MHKRFLLLAILAAFPPPLSAANLLENPGFEAGANFWLLPPSGRIFANAASPPGAMCAELTAGEKEVSLSQCSVSVKAGYGYRFSFKARAEGYSGRIHSALSLPETRRRYAGKAITPTAEWKTYRHFFVASEDADDCELRVACSPGEGRIFFDEFELVEIGRVTGMFAVGSVDENESGLALQTRFYKLSLGKGRAYAPEALVVNGNKLLDFALLSLSIRGERPINDFFGNLPAEISVEDKEDRLAIRTIIYYGDIAVVTRVIEAYKGRPYLKLSYEIEAKKDFSCARTTLNLGVGNTLNSLGYFANNAVTYRKNDKPQWFSVDRHDSERYLCYLDDYGSHGLAIIGADASSWKKLPGQLLCSARTDGGFTLELIQWNKREVRAGDKAYFELFLLPLGGNRDASAARVLREISAD
jgi:hypothetical protein